MCNLPEDVQSYNLGKGGLGPHQQQEDNYTPSFLLLINASYKSCLSNSHLFSDIKLFIRPDPKAVPLMMPHEFQYFALDYTLKLIFSLCLFLLLLQKILVSVTPRD